MGKDIVKISEFKFWNELYRKAAKGKIPIDVLFELTYNCNISCPHCYKIKDIQKKELTFKEVTSIIDGLHDMGCMTIAFTGGELFTREDASMTLEYADTKGIFIEILTNAILIDKRIIDILNKIKLSRVFASVYGLTKKTYRKVTGEDLFYDCLSGIYTLKDNNIPLTINMLVTKDNIHEIALVSDFAKSIGADFQADPYINPASNRDKQPLTKRVTPKRYLKSSIYKTFGKITEYDISNNKKINNEPKNNSRFFHCDAGKRAMVIDPYGMASLCLSLPSPKFSILEGGVASAWGKLVAYRDSLAPDNNYECPDCELQYCCDWCPGHAYLETGSISKCVPYLKEVAIQKRYAEFKDKI